MSILEKCVNLEKKVRAERNVMDRKARQILFVNGTSVNDLDALQAAKEGMEITDEEIMAEYIKLAGLVKDDPTTIRPTPEQVENSIKEKDKMEKEEKGERRPRMLGKKRK